MKIVRLIVVLIAMSIGFVAHAVSPLWEINPKGLDLLPMFFDIRWKHLARIFHHFSKKLAKSPR